MKRWSVTLFYRFNLGLVDVTHEVEELEEIQELVERGPDWNALDRVEIRLIEPLWQGATVEEMNHFNSMTQAEVQVYLKERK